MIPDAHYCHTNLIARDWKRLADFYQDVFGCRPVPPERDLSGAWLDGVTRLPGAHLRGMHLRLPGYGDDGPTLEIFQYEPELPVESHPVNRPGYGHLAFAVADVEAARQAVLAAGGGQVGDLVNVIVSGAGPICFVYMTDPEGNVIELQRWGD
ncbi:MAG: VOC family protein [Chloroflexi bacterium]|jgi:catechol 2,3-dioxygenase-like lactoylglutathione lyase family enzyme|nr:VOC family protein [Anaerolineaceae bacterium]NMB90722.1 VOC family protein [Chloroflexota bacterium]